MKSILFIEKSRENCRFCSGHNDDIVFALTVKPSILFFNRERESFVKIVVDLQWEGIYCSERESSTQCRGILCLKHR